MNNAKTGGILSIVSGGLGVMTMLSAIVFGTLFLVTGWMGDDSMFYNGIYPEIFMSIMAVFYIVWGIVCGILGVFAIVGGVFGIRRKRWGWALAGSIVSCLTFWPCGIPAVIFTVMGKPEFNGNNTPQAKIPPPMEKIVG